MTLVPQILLPLEGRRPDRFEDFVPGENAALVESLTQLVKEGGQSLFLSGPAGSGKTHLLNAACNLAAQLDRPSFYIAPGRMPADAAAGLASLEGMQLVCIDDVDQIAGDSSWEEAMFHCFNRVRADGGSLVASSHLRLSALEFSLPDLASRLAWGLRLPLQPLGDADKAEVMRRWADSHGIQLPVELQNYLLNRGSRSLATLLDHLEQIRQAALAGKRRLTLPLAREVLGQSD